MTRNNQIVHYSIFLLITLLVPGACKNENRKDLNGNFEKVYPLALRGEMNDVLNYLDTIDIKSLSDEERKIRQKFIGRFKNGELVSDLNIKDKYVTELVKLFRSYWTDVMLENLTVEIADSLLIQDLANLLLEDPSYERHSMDSIFDNPYDYVNEYLQAKGFYSNAMGKTAQMYDLFLWEHDEAAKYNVALINGTISVEVHFIKDFISQGWTHYATLGKNYASGWATSESLFTMDNAYDRNSEKFTVSYLAHEAQHFSDYINYPDFGQKELEYRAKLVEIIKSDSTTLNIIRKFLKNSKAGSSNAHAWANYEVISDLSKVLFDESFVSDLDKWSLEVTKIDIKKTSEILFSKSIEKLKSL